MKIELLLRLCFVHFYKIYLATLTLKRFGLDHRFHKITCPRLAYDNERHCFKFSSNSEGLKHEEIFPWYQIQRDV